ncbi:MAG: alpha-glucuronidase family glycosyl hydrolase [Spirosomataceae bacterium]
MLKRILIGCFVLITLATRADDGYRLWLKYDLLKKQPKVVEYKRFTKFIVSEMDETPILKTAQKELKKGLEGLLGGVVSNTKSQGGVVFRLDKSLPLEGFSLKVQDGNIIVSAHSDRGILYGVFELLRHIQTEKSMASLSLTSSPKIQLRMLNHWDNVNGTIERGYAGASLWKWYELPETLDPRYTDYARANASIGINAVSVNNVNASPRFLTAEYLPKVKALADIFRPYGIKVFLSLNFASPKVLGKLKTSDPLDPEVRKWWQEKTKEIYSYIPDFGGFLVKANSEGEPGPQEYGRTHADGANMLAEAIKPFGGVVIWRAFVYAANPKGDRFKEAYNEFKPLDGQFAPNVIVQVKNGPIDFMPREPFHPLFGAMPKTPLAMEFQITQEYLGFTTNLVFQPSVYKECLESDTYANGKGSTVAKVVDGTVHRSALTAIAGVANTGSDRNWTGHLMSQANWYGYGRLAWNHEISAEAIADEWVKMTLTKSPQSVSTIKAILLKSREVYVNHTNPLGLHHIMGQNIHFGPEPWLERSARPDWTAIYYHRADSVGIGFNRLESGSNAISLYNPETQKQWRDSNTTDLRYLMWFHHVPWTQQLSTGRSLWDELCTRYYHGVEEVAQMQQEWETLKGTVDSEMFEDVKGRLAVQHREALNWRDACVLYFQTFSKLPIPAPYQAPTRTLDEMKKIVAIYQMR